MDNLSVNLYKIQMMYFFKENSDFKAFELIVRLYHQFKDIFINSEPQSLPIPDDAPDDVPRCIWNDNNTSIMFNKFKLEFTFNIPTKIKWDEYFVVFNQKIAACLDEHNITIDRVSLIGELISLNDLHEVLKEYVHIPQFNHAKEANISWLEEFEGYNLWTYFFLNDNRVVFDINSFQDRKLSEQGINYENAMEKCADFLERKMNHVLYPIQQSII